MPLFSYEEERQSSRACVGAYYRADIKNLLNYDFVVDTTEATPDQVSECVTEGFNRWLENNEYKCAFLSPERINYPNIDADNDLITTYAFALDRGEELPEIKVFEEDGEFYLLEGLEAAMAYAFSMATFIPTTLVDHKRGDEEYVRMKNSL